MPHQLTPDEVAAIEDFVTGDDYRHVPTGTLAILAQRMGKVFASASTWCRLSAITSGDEPGNAFTSNDDYLTCYHSRTTLTLATWFAVGARGWKAR